MARRKGLVGNRSHHTLQPIPAGQVKCECGHGKMYHRVVVQTGEALFCTHCACCKFKKAKVERAIVHAGTFTTSNGKRTSLTIRMRDKIIDDSRELAPRYGQCEPVDAASVVIQMRIRGQHVTVRNYLDWLDGGSTYNVFERAALRVLKVKKADLAKGEATVLFPDGLYKALGVKMAR